MSFSKLWGCTGCAFCFPTTLSLSAPYLSRPLDEWSGCSGKHQSNMPSFVANPWRAFHAQHYFKLQGLVACRTHVAYKVGTKHIMARSQQKKKRCGQKRKFQPFSVEREGARRRGNATSKHSPGEDLRKEAAHTHDLRRRRIRFAWLSLTCPAQSSRQVQPTPLGGFGIACRLLHSP